MKHRSSPKKNDRRLHKRKIDHRHFFFLLCYLSICIWHNSIKRRMPDFFLDMFSPPLPHTFFCFEMGGARTASKTEGVLCPFVQGSPGCNCTEFAGRGITRYTEPDKWSFAQNQFPINTSPLFLLCRTLWRRMIHDWRYIYGFGLVLQENYFL